jgi:hypothetical protein
LAYAHTRVGILVPWYELLYPDVNPGVDFMSC